MIRLNKRAEHIIQDVIKETPINIILATGLVEFMGACSNCPANGICAKLVKNGHTCSDALYMYLEGEMDGKQS